ncbi:MAG: hypothetical protein AMXMBFR33_30940 [Candidatus Xenobia bacterium]|jgi:hypothetical protein
MKLCQILAIEKQVKTKVNSEGSKLLNLSKKSELFFGRIREYIPVDADGEHFPSESQRVQQRAQDHLEQQFELFRELFDTVAAKDWANCSAKADVKVGGRLLLADVPVTYLLFLEKQFEDLKTTIAALPVLGQDHSWTLDSVQGLFKTEEVVTSKTRVVKKPIVLAEATKEHPAQTALIDEPVVAGHWKTIFLSGALTPDRRKELLRRVDEALKAVKQAREEANSVQASEVKAGSALLDWILEP